MTQLEPINATTEASGLRRFALESAGLAAAASPGLWGKVDFMRQMGGRYAYIRIQDIGQPLRFLRQMAGAPPVQLGTEGFRTDILDDYNPARHYTAFVWVGFWLPLPLAIAMLYLWEVASYVRYQGHWSQGDVVSGLIGVRHGVQVRRGSCATLPRLIATELADPEAVDVAALVTAVDAVLAEGNAAATHR